MRAVAPAAALAAALALGGLTAPAASAQSDDARIAQTTEELERVRNRMRALSRQVARDNKKRSSVARALQSAEQRIGELLSALSKLEADIAEEQRAIAANEAERDRLAADVATQRAALARQIRAAYSMGRQERTKLLLNQQDPVAVGRILTYYDYVARARSERIARFTALADQLRAVTQRLAENVADLKALRAERNESLTAMESSRRARQDALEKLEQRLASSRDQIKQLASDEQQLQELIESLQDVLADIPLQLDTGKPFGQRRGELQWPLSGRLLAGFGQQKAGSLRWRGVWIAGSEGDPVYAIAPGRVAFVGWMHRFGLMIVVEHDDGWFSLYGHTQTAYKDIGEWVREGEPLAAAGNSGGHRRNGVYFELRRGDRPVDPVGWLRPR